MGDVEAAIIREQLSPEMHAKLTEEIDMLNMAGEDFDIDSVYSGQMTPVFFGSAMNNFGVELLLKELSQMLSTTRGPGQSGSHHPDRSRGLHRLHLQDPGQHGSQAPRPHRFCPHLLGQV